MFTIRIAELNVKVNNRYPYAERFCREFFCECTVPDIEVCVSDEELEAERLLDPYNSTDGYLECICIYRKIALELPRFDAMVFHASVVSVDGMAYAFAAHSGTGKSTHTDLWLRVFGERAKIVNGDKPIFRLIDGRWHAFGTPWRGKEGLGDSTSAPLRAICFLERGKNNEIAPLGDAEAVSRLFSQVLLPREADMAEKQLSLLDHLISSTPTYLLRCNMLPEAAVVSYQAMSKEN